MDAVGFKIPGGTSRAKCAVSATAERDVASARLIPRRKRAKNGKKNKRTKTAEGGKKKSPYFSLFHFQGTPVTCLAEVILLLSAGKQGRGEGGGGGRRKK